MAPRKTCCFGYLLVVTKRRYRVSNFCATKSKDFVAATSRLSLFSSFRATLQSEKRRKTYWLFIHLSPHSQHERQICQSKTFCGFLKGIRPLSSLSWFVLSRMRKNEHQYSTPNAREALCEAVGEVVENSNQPQQKNLDSCSESRFFVIPINICRPRQTA